MILGEKIYNLRKNKNISHEQFAFELDVSKTSVIKWEANKAKPSIDNLMKICDYFETDIYTLLEDVSNINFSGAKFAGSSYAAYAQNFTVNNHNSPEIIKSIIDNQNKITEFFDLQTQLISKLLLQSK
jgi:transcriptional regulator with XRE-family HTH domain